MQMRCLQTIFPCELIHFTQKKQLLLNEIKGVENVENDKTLDKETLEAFVESWEEITIDEKIMVVDSLISVIKVTETNIKIIWKSELFSKGVNE